MAKLSVGLAVLTGAILYGLPAGLANLKMAWIISVGVLGAYLVWDTITKLIKKERGVQ